MHACHRQTGTAVRRILSAVLLFIGCSGDSSNSPDPGSDILERVGDVMEFQNEMDSELADLFSVMDATAALDSLQKLVLADESVETADANDQGLIIEYASGIVGGIFVDPQDDPDDTDLDSDGVFESPMMKPAAIDTPGSINTIFINPHYEDRRTHADPIMQSYDRRFLQIWYEPPVKKLGSAATLDVFADLDPYGIVHVYTHGCKYTRNGQLIDILLMTGESANDATTAKYGEDIRSGRLPIVKIHQGEQVYYIAPQFISDHNDFAGSRTIFYGGFCYSFLGTWPEKIVTTAGAGAYLGFDWRVKTVKNADWAKKLFYAMTDQSKPDPVTIDQWFNDESVPKKYWQEVDSRWVRILRKQADNKDMALWVSDESPFNRMSFMVKIDGHYRADVVTPDSSYSYEYDSDGGSISTWSDYEGSFTGPTFNGTLSATSGTGQIEGTITADFDARMQTITSLTWTETVTYPTHQTTETFTGVNIPFDYSYYQARIYQIEGEGAGSSITSLTADQTAPEGLSYSLLSWSTDWNCKVWASLTVEE